MSLVNVGFKCQLIVHEPWRRLQHVLTKATLATWDSNRLSIWTLPVEKEPRIHEAEGRPEERHAIILWRLDLLIIASNPDALTSTIVECISLEDGSVEKLRIPGRVDQVPLIQDTRGNIVITVFDEDWRATAHVLEVTPVLKSLRSITIGRGTLPRDATLDVPNTDDATSLQPVGLINDETIIAKTGTILNLNQFLSIWPPSDPSLSAPSRELLPKIEWKPALEESDRFRAYPALYIPQTSQFVIAMYESRHSFPEFRFNTGTVIRAYPKDDSTSTMPTETWTVTLDYPLNSLRYHPNHRAVVAVGYRDIRIDANDPNYDPSVIVTVMSHATGRIICERELLKDQIDGNRFLLAESTEYDELVLVTTSGMVSVVAMGQVVEYGIFPDARPGAEIAGYKPIQTPAPKKRRNREDTAGSRNWVSSACLSGKRVGLFPSKGPEFVIVNW